MTIGTVIGNGLIISVTLLLFVVGIKMVFLSMFDDGDGDDSEHEYQQFLMGIVVTALGGTVFFSMIHVYILGLIRHLS